MLHHHAHIVAVHVATAYHMRHSFVPSAWLQPVVGPLQEDFVADPASTETEAGGLPQIGHVIDGVAINLVVDPRMGVIAQATYPDGSVRTLGSAFEDYEPGDPLPAQAADSSPDSDSSAGCVSIARRTSAS